MPSLLRLWHLASLDAPTVAVVWSLAFARAASIHLPPWVPVLLAMGTWAVYIGDRLLDAGSAWRSGNLSRLRERHYFHWTHRRVLTPLAIAAAAASIAIIFFLMPPGIRERNAALAVATLAYFSGTHISVRAYRRFPRLFSKELLVGILFTAGCAFPTLSRLPLAGNTGRSVPLFVAFGFFALLAWVNCFAIDCWEAGISSSIAIGACILASSGLVLAFLFSSTGKANIAPLFVQGSIGALFLALLDRVRDRMLPLTLRTAADLVLLTPLLFLAR
jgi:hypothetical protein